MPTMMLTAGMHNIRPAGQMWPAEALNLARQPLVKINIISVTLYLSKFCIQIDNFGPHDCVKKNFGPRTI